MKKVLSLLLVVGMLCAMMVPVNAINKDGSFAFASDVTEVTVGDTFVVKVMHYGDTDPEVGLKSCNFKVSATANATFDSAENGAASADYSSTNNFNKATGVLQVMDSNADIWAKGNGEYAILTFTATEAGTFTITNTSINAQWAKAGTTEKFTLRTAVAPLSITIKEDAPVVPPFTPETIKADAAIAATADVITLPKSEGSSNTNDYTQVAVFTGSFEAATNYSKAGLIWVKDGVESTNTFDVADGNAVSGAGSFEYNVAMYAIPTGVTITAIPYYVTAQ